MPGKLASRSGLLHSRLIVMDVLLECLFMSWAGYWMVEDGVMLVLEAANCRASPHAPGQSLCNGAGMPQSALHASVLVQSCIKQHSAFSYLLLTRTTSTLPA